MKIKLTLLAALLCFAGISQAQNILQQGFDNFATNGAAGGGYWRGLTGNYNIASYDYVYNLSTETNSLGAGLIVGGDYLWSGKNNHVQNDVKGGFNINYKGNLSTIGMTNTGFCLVGGNAIATPRQKGAGVGDITFAGLDLSFRVYKQVHIHFDPSWQKRVGQGVFDRQYVGVQVFGSLKF